jgi:hypothetical protein
MTRGAVRHQDFSRIVHNRGNGGQRVWKVEVSPDTDTKVRVLHAQRGSRPEEIPLDAFITRCEPYFGWGGCIIDQAFQPRLPEGMIRCYMSGSKVAGFGHQLIKALIPSPPEGPDSPQAQPGARIMHGPESPTLRSRSRRAPRPPVRQSGWHPRRTTARERFSGRSLRRCVQTV